MEEWSPVIWLPFVGCVGMCVCVWVWLCMCVSVHVSLVPMLKRLGTSLCACMHILVCLYVCV